MRRTVAPLALAGLAGACTLMPEENVFEPGLPGVRDPAGVAEGTSGGDAPDPEPSDAPTTTASAAESSSGGAWEPESSTSGPDPDPESTSTGEAPDLGDACASEVLDGPLAGSTLGESNERAGSCGGDQAPERALSFTADEDGLYTFDTNGSDFDTVLYVLDGDCFGPELACDDDGGESLQSSLTVPLAAGQSVVVVVDGFSANDGAFMLDVTAQTADGCQPSPLAGALPLTVDDVTAGPSEYEGSCGGGSAPEQVYSWTAPAAGTYTVHTTGSDYDTVLHVRDGSCVGPELGCNDDGGPGLQSSLTLDLAGGQTIVIFADGYSSNAGALSVTVES